MAADPFAAAAALFGGAAGDDDPPEPPAPTPATGGGAGGGTAVTLDDATLAAISAAAAAAAKEAVEKALESKSPDPDDEDESTGGSRPKPKKGKDGKSPHVKELEDNFEELIGQMATLTVGAQKISAQLREAQEREEQIEGMKEQLRNMFREPAHKQLPGGSEAKTEVLNGTVMHHFTDDDAVEHLRGGGDPKDIDWAEGQEARVLKKLATAPAAPAKKGWKRF